jgi:hypothetical protein
MVRMCTECVPEAQLEAGGIRWWTLLVYQRNGQFFLIS